MISPQELLFQARLMESYGADCVYVTDSAGALTPDGFRERVRTLKEGLNIPVGNTGIVLGGANLIPIKVDGTVEYDPLSDFPDRDLAVAGPAAVRG